MTNSIQISGRLTKDPEKSTTNSGIHCVRFTIANSIDKNTTYFFNVVAYGGTADFIAKYFKKSSGIDIGGRLEYYVKEKDGEKYTNYQIWCNTVNFPVGGNVQAESKPAPDVSAEW